MECVTVKMFWVSLNVSCIEKIKIAGNKNFIKFAYYIYQSPVSSPYFIGGYFYARDNWNRTAAGEAGGNAEM